MGKIAGSSNVIVDMLMELRWSAIRQIASAFDNRLQGHAGTPKEWSQLILSLIPKRAKANDLNVYRDLTLIDVVAKWSMSCHVVLAKRTTHDLRPPGYAETATFGFESGVSVEAAI